MPILIISAVFFFAFTALAYAILYRPPRTEEVEAKAKPGDTGRVEEREAGAKAKKTRPASRLGRQLLPSGYAEYLRKQLLYAGSPRGLTIDDVPRLKISMAGAAVLLTLPLFLIRPSFLRFLLMIAAALIAFFVMDVWLSGKADRRQTRISLDLPDMLDLLTISVEAGLGFDAALAKVIENSKGPLTDEFKHLLQEVHLGISRKQAFHNLSARTYAPELRYFILAIIQAETFGISIGNVLRNQSVEMKRKRRQVAEEKAMKTPVKIIFPLLLCIFPALLIVIIGPAGIRISETLSHLGR